MVNIRLLLAFHASLGLASICMAEVNASKWLSQKSLSHQREFDFSTAVNSSRSKVACTADTDCPPWGICNNSRCVCREELSAYNTLKCEPETLQLSVVRCHCVTFSNETREIFHGKCIENCENGYTKSEYLPLPLNVSRLNQFMCEEKWNRTGRLCGKCLPGHSPLAYSYDLRCVKCPEGNRNVWKYILVAFGPLTIFYFTILLVKINATSSHLHGYLVFSQIISTPAFARDIILYMKNHKQTSIPIQLVGVMYSIWNLDFFRILKLTDTCLDVSGLTILALDYAVAIYPLLLTVLSYFLIELHVRNIRIVVILWKPFRSLLTLFRKNWDSRSTIIDAYATFFALSYTKILSVSADLLIPVRAYSLTNDSVTWVLYYDATVDYFGREHLPYAILAIVLSSLLLIVPTLLLIVYPFKSFHKILNCLKFHSQTLVTLMDSFQGCYKDGTVSGTRDCRWFVSVPLIGRITILIAYMLTLDNTVMALGSCIAVSIVILITGVQPYKTQFTNYSKIDVFFWGCLAMFYTLEQSADFVSLKPAKEIRALEVLGVIVAVIPLLYMCCVTAHWLLTKTIKPKRLLSRIKAWRKGYTTMETDFEETLPDRMMNPGNYQEATLQSPIGQNVTLRIASDTY